MYKIIKQANNGWEIHEVPGFSTIALVKYEANHQDINKIIKILRALYNDKVVEGPIDMNMAMRDEYLQPLSVGEYDFIINLDFWENLVFDPKQEGGNSYVWSLFQKLAIETD
ncbi:hypothetical protein [Clostridium manihotivorum]|uniref:Uncharacterized protein n=1 Tax=Clostridium manihotivorum TaxID=2320868 RepID=A0A3R5QTK5_9CLOT|nr:hypothetical protein [Clostridium manihotivorum]QAA32267.1 hypothetical protein C1I91_11795 [Clostridium manihotivorum]